MKLVESRELLVQLCELSLFLRCQGRSGVDEIVVIDFCKPLLLGVEFLELRAFVDGLDPGEKLRILRDLVEVRGQLWLHFRLDRGEVTSVQTR